MTFDRGAASVAQVRRFVLGAAEGLPAPVSDAITLMVSELATNVVRHVGSDYRVDVRRDAAGIEVRVTDDGGGRPTMRSPLPDDPTGRGILIVETLSDAWGTDIDEDTNLTTVWFRVELSTSSRR
jgi:serine/threonine-protein kinase RsbW